MFDFPDEAVMNLDPGFWFMSTLSDPFNYDYAPPPLPNDYLGKAVGEFLGLGRDPDEPTIVEVK